MQNNIEQTINTLLTLNTILKQSYNRKKAYATYRSTIRTMKANILRYMLQQKFQQRAYKYMPTDGAIHDLEATLLTYKNWYEDKETLCNRLLSILNTL